MISTKTTILTRTVTLSARHAGQMIEHTASMEADAEWVVVGRDAFGQPRHGWRHVSVRAKIETLDLSDRTRDVNISPWSASPTAAEAWLASRGLTIESTGPWTEARPE